MWWSNSFLDPRFQAQWAYWVCLWILIQYWIIVFDVKYLDLIEIQINGSKRIRILDGFAWTLANNIRGFRSHMRTRKGDRKDPAKAVYGRTTTAFIPRDGGFTLIAIVTGQNSRIWLPLHLVSITISLPSLLSRLGVGKVRRPLWASIRSSLSTLEKKGGRERLDLVTPCSSCEIICKNSFFHMI